MNNKIVKTFLIAIILLILLSPAYLSDVEKNIENEEKIEEITLIKHSPDGTIKPIKVKIEIEKNENLDEKIVDKCEELTKKDDEIQNYINNLDENNTSKIKGFLVKVKSSGKGFHFKFKTKLKICVKKKLLSLSLPKIIALGRIPFIYCNYKNDPNAYTQISPLIKNDVNSTKIINGNHTIFVYNFVGFTSWTGRFSFTPFDMLPRGFSGIALYAKAKST